MRSGATADDIRFVHVSWVTGHGSTISGVCSASVERRGMLDEIGGYGGRKAASDAYQI